MKKLPPKTPKNKPIAKKALKYRSAKHQAAKKAIPSFFREEAKQRN